MNFRTKDKPETPRPPNPESQVVKKRVQYEFSPAALDSIKEAKRYFDAGYDAEAVRRSLRMTSFFSRMADDGFIIMIKGKDGEVVMVDIA